MIRDNVELDNRKLAALESIRDSLRRIAELLEKVPAKKGALEKLIGR